MGSLNIKVYLRDSSKILNIEYIYFSSTLLVESQVSVNGAYKRKSQKIQHVALSLSNGSRLYGSNTWRLDAIKGQILIFVPIDKYTYCFITKFILIAK